VEFAVSGYQSRVCRGRGSVIGAVSPLVVEPLGQRGIRSISFANGFRCMFQSSGKVKAQQFDAVATDCLIVERVHILNFFDWRMLYFRLSKRKKTTSFWSNIMLLERKVKPDICWFDYNW